MACGCGCDGSHTTAYYCQNCDVFFGLPADFSTDNYTLIQLASADRKGAPLVAKDVRFAPCGCIPEFIYQILVMAKPNAIDRYNCPPPVVPTPAPAPSCCVTITPVPLVPLTPEVPEPATPPPPGPCDCVTLPAQRNADRTYYRYPWPDLF